MKQPTEEQIEALADAMVMVMNDMAPDGDLSVCAYVKAKARVAVEPFLLEDSGDLPDLEWAKKTVASCEGAYS